jgi:hypothetical protein
MKENATAGWIIARIAEFQNLAFWEGDCILFERRKASMIKRQFVCEPF